MSIFDNQQKTVPMQLFEELHTQVGQLLQMMAAITLSEEEIEELQEPESRGNPNMKGWGPDMKEELLSEDGIQKIKDILLRYGFLRNSHSGFIYGVFEKRPITFRTADCSNSLQAKLEAYAKGEGKPLKNPEVQTHFREIMLKEYPEEVVDQVFSLLAVWFPTAQLDRLSLEATKNTP